MDLCQNIRIRLILALFTLLASAASSYAQTVENNLLKTSVDPYGDSLFFAETRARMDSIRRTEKRPTVGLVLAGGGAKGAATVGVIKYLEELGIPIDLVTGTSIGGLLGSLYSIGYNADELKEIMLAQDWDVMLGDKVDEKFVPRDVKDYRAQYILTIPFNLGKKFLSSIKDGDHIFVTSLPAGIAEGFNVNKLISQLTVGYQDDISFADLPVPFACVAGDMVSNREKNFGGGDLTRAMRSTMSIPGLFNPVEYKNMVLVDGGVRNNIPVDLARAMGADYTIVVSLVQDEEKLPNMNIANVAGSLMNLLTYDTVEDSRKMSDIYINPVLDGYGMLSFDSEAVMEMYEMGYQTALSHREDLLRLKDLLGAKPKAVDSSRKAVDFSKRTISISDISFEGVDEKTAQALGYRVLKLHKKIETDKLSLEEVETVVNTLKASGAYKNVRYSLLGAAEPYELVIHCDPMPANRLGIGVRMDNQDWVELRVNIGLNTNTIKGHSLDLTSKLGNNLRFTAKYRYTFIDFPSLNMEFSTFRVRPDFWIPNQGRDERRMIHSLIYGHSERVYFNLARSRFFQFNGGLMYRSATVDWRSELWSELKPLYPSEYMRVGFMGLFLNLNFDNLNDEYFPLKGHQFKLNGNWEFLSPQIDAFAPTLSIGLDYKGVFSIGRRFSFIPKLSVRMLFNDNPHYSIYHNNYFGGDFHGRYTEQQIGYFGVNGIAIADPFISTLELEARVNIFKKLYASLLAGSVKEALTYKDFFSTWSHQYYSLGANLSYSSIVGPLKLCYHYTDEIGHEFYFSIGYNF